MEPRILLNEDGSLRETPEQKKASEIAFAEYLKQIEDENEIAPEDPDFDTDKED